jgi:predicted RecB family nuclease
MGITPIDSSVSDMVGIERINDLLKNINQAKMGIEEKMMKASVVENLTGLGDIVDTRA